MRIKSLKTDKRPLVSIIILNYNGRRWLKPCLTSLRRLTYPNYEVILVDNASIDGSVDSVSADFPWVKIIRNKRNLGYAEGNNIGIRHANGSLIAILNMDTIVDPYWISELVEVAISDPKIGACGGKIYDYFDKKNLQFPDPLVIPSKLYDKIQDVWSIYGAGFLVKRDVLEIIGLFDPEYFCYYEEIDLCWRIRLAGFRVVFVPKAVMYHFQGGAQIARKPLIYLNFKNRLRTILKNCQIETLPLYLPILALQVGFALFLVFYPRKRKEGLLRIEAYIKASLWNLLKLRNTIKERAKIQRLRKVSDIQLRVISTDLVYLLFLHKRPIYL